MAFNPDEYIKENNISFDPDEYLAESSEQSEIKPEEDRGYISPITDIAKSAGGKILETVKGVGEMISNPLETAKFLGEEISSGVKQIPELVTKTLPEAAEGAILAREEIAKEPVKSIQSLASGAAQAIPGTLIAPAYDLALQRAKAQGKNGITSQELEQAYNEIAQQREASIAESPLAGLTGEAVGLAGTFPIAKKAGGIIGGATETVGARAAENIGTIPLRGTAIKKAGEEAYVSAALKPSTKELQKINKINPNAGETLLKEGITGSNKEMLEKIKTKLEETGPKIGEILKQADIVSDGKFVLKSDVIKEIENLKKNQYSSTNIAKAKAKPIDELIDMIEREPDEFLSAEQLQDYKTTLQEAGFPGTTLADRPIQKMARQTSNIIKNILQEKLQAVLPDQEVQNIYKTHSDLSSAKQILEKKHDLPWVEVNPIAGVVGGAFGGITGVPAALLPGITKKITKEILPRRSSRFKAAIGEKLEASSPNVTKIRAIIETLNPVQKRLVERLVEKGIEISQAINMVRSEENKD